MASLSANPAAAEQPGPPLARAGAGARVFQNTVVLLAGRGAGVFLSAGAAVILARYLGSERLGQFGALYAYLSLFAWLAGLGIEPVLAREASRQRELAGSILLTGVALCGLFGVGTALFAVLFAPVAGYSGYLQVLLVFAAIDLLVLLPLRLPGVIFQVDLKQWYGVGINVLRQENPEDLSGIDPPPAFISDVRELGRDELLQAVLRHADSSYEVLRSPEAIARAWEAAAGIPGTRYCLLLDETPAPFDATALALGKAGELIVDTDGSRRSIAMAEARVLRS